MSNAPPPAIRLRGVRHHNLKNFDLELPLQRLIVVTGLSGSGKSSLAFDTLFAEGQRRYIETFSPYARQFFDRMDKPQVDSIEGIPPAIAIEQRNTVRSTRSTVGTMTEICDYMKLLWPQVAQLYCRRCGQLVRKDSPAQIWAALWAEGGPAAGLGEGQRAGPGPPRQTARDAGQFQGCDLAITFDLPLSAKLSLAESLALVAKQGYQRLMLNGEVLRLEEALPRLERARPNTLTVVQDRLQLAEANRARFAEACEQAYHFGKGKLVVHRVATGRPPNQAPGLRPLPFSNLLHCATCNLEYREPSPALFSFNHPVGACPACRGFGRTITIDYDLAMPDRRRTLAQGVVKPWLSGISAECQEDLLKFCRQRRVPTDVPFDQLPPRWQQWVINGDADYGQDPRHEWPHAWYGVKGYFRWLESKAYKMHVRVLLSRYRSYQTCPECQGQRFQPESLAYKVALADLGFAPTPPSDDSPLPAPVSCPQPTLTLAGFYQLPIRDARRFIEALAAKRKPQPSDPIRFVLEEVQARLGYLVEVGLGYLTLDRPTRTLSGGETERVNLTTCLGARLVNTLFVLDEPSVGLHPRDTARLVRILEHLRATGNTVVVVEHEPSVIRAADQIVDLGPGHGETGGQVVYQGPFPELLRCEASLTGQYLSGGKRIEIPARRPVLLPRPGPAPEPNPNLSAATPATETATAGEGAAQRAGAPFLTIAHASRHNLFDLSVQIPLGRLVCITGVSGSGKTTLVREVLLPALESKLKAEGQAASSGAATKRTEAHDAESAVGNRQSAIGNPDSAFRTPHSALLSPPHPSPLPQWGRGNAPDSALRAPRSALLGGWEQLGRVVLVDQSALGKTPRSNPAVYIGAFDEIRAFFADSEPARQRGLKASAFSFNSAQGQCERCRGAGFERIEMQFLSDVFIRCPDCDGRRYRPHVLEVAVCPRSEGNGRQEAGGGGQEAEEQGSSGAEERSHVSRITHRASRFTSHVSRALTVAELLDATVDEAIAFLGAFPESRPANRAVARLRLLQDIGLGYLRLGQPINTLSGGESQRLKLASHLAESAAADIACCPPRPSLNPQPSTLNPQPSTLFLFDEPTTGLHFDDVRVLLQVLQRLVDAGHSVLVIEHNLELIKCADWVIDLGPEAGDQGGHIVAEGTPEQIAACPHSHTGAALRELGLLANAHAA
jgi:excinuclease ABC subunit A